MKRIVLFLATNLAIIVLLSIVLRLLGVESILDAQGVDLDLGKLLVFAAVVGFTGSFVSIGPRAGLSEAGMMTQLGRGHHVRSHAFNYRGRSGTLLAFDSAATVVANIPGWVDKKAKGTGTILAAYDSRPDRAEPTWSVRLAAGERVHRPGARGRRRGRVRCGGAHRSEPARFVRLLARDTGSTVLDRPLDGVPGWDPMALAGGRIYISSGDGRLFCLGER